MHQMLADHIDEFEGSKLAYCGLGTVEFGDPGFVGPPDPATSGVLQAEQQFLNPAPPPPQYDVLSFVNTPLQTTPSPIWGAPAVTPQTSSPLDVLSFLNMPLQTTPSPTWGVTRPAATSSFSSIGSGFLNTLQSAVGLAPVKPVVATHAVASGQTAPAPRPAPSGGAGGSSSFGAILAPLIAAAMPLLGSGGGKKKSKVRAGTKQPAARGAHGSSLTPYLLIGGGALAIGTVMVFMARSRKAGSGNA